MFLDMFLDDFPAAPVATFEGLHYVVKPDVGKRMEQEKSKEEGISLKYGRREEKEEAHIQGSQEMASPRVWTEKRASIHPLRRLSGPEMDVRKRMEHQFTQTEGYWGREWT